MKRHLLSLLAGVVLCFCLCVPAFADHSDVVTFEQTTTEGTITYQSTVGSGYWRLASCSDNVKNMTVLDKISYQKDGKDYSGPVHFDGFRNNTHIVNVVLPKGEGFTKIDGFSFSGCSALTSITIPESVSSIGAYAFQDCTSLKTVRLPSSGLTTIESDAFSNCTSLTEITIPGSVIALTSPSSTQVSAFSNCPNLSKVTFQDGIKVIPNYAFSRCTGLSNVSIPASVTQVGNGAFSQCTALAQLALPKGLLAIGNEAFASTGLSAVAIPSTVKTIGDGAFSYCSALQSISLPNGLTALGKDAFSHCSKLSSLTIPGSVKEVDSICGSGSSMSSLSSLSFCEGVTKITGFHDASALKSVSIPASVVELNAFSDCYNLEDLFYCGSNDQWNKIQIADRCYRLNYIAQGQVEKTTFHVNSSPATLPVSFDDVLSNAYYYLPVQWASSNGITTGTSSSLFSPEESCSHAQILTFLWRAAGEPDSNEQPPISLNGSEFYFNALKWAAEQNMISANFKPDDPCSRLDAVNYIWLAFGKPAANYDGRFSDIPANSPYASAVAWAVEKNVTNGTAADTFSPTLTCSRGQIVTFLYRAFH